MDQLSALGIHHALSIGMVSAPLRPLVLVADDNADLADSLGWCLDLDGYHALQRHRLDHDPLSGHRDRQSDNLTTLSDVPAKAVIIRPIHRSTSSDLAVIIRRKPRSRSVGIHSSAARKPALTITW